MFIEKSYITLTNVSFYAYHGVSLQERVVGNFFFLSLKLKVNFLRALETDNVLDTVSYADVYRSVSDEMSVPSHLLEYVCGRIVRRLFRDFQAVEEIDIRLFKRNPPMGADIESAGVEMFCLRSECSQEAPPVAT